MAVSINAVAPLCPNELSGYISIMPSGGVYPFLINGVGLLDSVLSFNSLSSGEYPFQILDNNGCYIDTSIILNGAHTYQPSANLLLRPCHDESNGVIELSGLPPGVEKLVLNGNIIPIENVLNDISSGTNQFMIEDSLGCKYEWGLEVMSVPQHFISIGQDVKYPIGTFVQVEAEAINNTFLNDLSLHWFSDNLKQVFCNDCSSIKFGLEGNTEVVLVATTQEGCVDSDTLKVSAESQNLYFPNIFAPNSNSDNALFVIQAPDDEQFNIELLEIFDRWGNLVFLKRNFSPNDNSVAWDGTSNGINCPAGVYIWHAKGRNSINYTGDVTLMR
jgi:gliding motility-associated-like protein